MKRDEAKSRPADDAMVQLSTMFCTMSLIHYWQTYIVMEGQMTKVKSLHQLLQLCLGAADRISHFSEPDPRRDNDDIVDVAGSIWPTPE